MNVIPNKVSYRANQHFLYLSVGTNINNPTDFVYIKSIYLLFIYYRIIMWFI